MNAKYHHGYMSKGLGEEEANENRNVFFVLYILSCKNRMSF